MPQVLATISLDASESKNLLTLIDLAVKANGLQVAQAALQLSNKIIAAGKEAAKREVQPEQERKEVVKLPTPPEP